MYTEQSPVIKVDSGIYSYLSRIQLKELKRCIAIAYPHYSKKDKKQQYVTLACQPDAAIRFMAHPDFKVQP